MEASDRRIGIRVDLEVFLTEYVRERPFRVLSQNLSETGLYFHRAPPVSPGGLRGRLGAVEPGSSWLLPSGTVVGLEIQLPGTGEVIWARGEVCREAWGRAVCGSGVRFADMPRVHARMVRDFCHDRRRARLDALLDRIRRSPSSESSSSSSSSIDRPMRRVPPPSRMPIA